MGSNILYFFVQHHDIVNVLLTYVKEIAKVATK